MRYLMTNEFAQSALNNSEEAAYGRWVPARPVRCRSFLRRLWDAWAVLRGRADALQWMRDVEPQGGNDA